MAINQATLEFFWNDFFLAYIFYYESFDVYIAIFGEKNILASEGGRWNFKWKEQPLQLFFLQKIKAHVCPCINLYSGGGVVRNVQPEVNFGEIVGNCKQNCNKTSKLQVKGGRKKNLVKKAGEEN